MRSRTTLTGGFNRAKHEREVLENRRGEIVMSKRIEHDHGKGYLEFIEYFKEFYGKTGLYPNTIPDYTTAEVMAGIVCRGGNFDGDTLDRELIRDMILKLRELK